MFFARWLIVVRSRVRKARTIPRPPLLRCRVLEIMNICAIIMGVETRIGINFHMISARHTRSRPANSKVELVRARQIELCWAFPEHANHKERKVEMRTEPKPKTLFGQQQLSSRLLLPHGREYLHNINFYVPRATFQNMPRSCDSTPCVRACVSGALFSPRRRSDSDGEIIFS